MSITQFLNRRVLPSLLSALLVIGGPAAARVPGTVVGTAAATKAPAKAETREIENTPVEQSKSVTVKSDDTTAKAETADEEKPTEVASLDTSITDNLIIDRYYRPPFAQGGLLNLTAIRQNGVNLIKQFGILARSGDQPIGSLSGGNMQKVIVAREFSSSPFSFSLSVPPTPNPVAGNFSARLRAALPASLGPALPMSFAAG